METDKPIIYEKIDEERVNEIDYLGFYFDQGTAV
jgi:hypothetical protein